MRKLLASAAALGVLLSACSSDTPEGEERLPEVAETSPAPANEDEITVFLADDDLYLSDSGTQETEKFVEVPSQQVAVTADAATYAYSTGGSDPRIFVGEVGSDRAEPLGPGFAPVFSPDGDRLAALIPDESYQICDTGTTDPSDDSCDTGRRVVVYDLERKSSKPRVVIGANLWDRLQWTGDRVAATIEGQPGVTLSPLTAGEPEVLPTGEARPLAVSPVDPRALVSNGALTYLAELDAGIRPLPIEAEASDATWSPDASHAAIVVTQGNGKPGVLLYDVQNSSGEVLPGSRGALGTPVWASDGTWFGFTKRSGRDHEVWTCSLARECERLFQASSEITLLAYALKD